MLGAGAQVGEWEGGTLENGWAYGGLKTGLKVRSLSVVKLSVLFYDYSSIVGQSVHIKSLIHHIPVF